MSDTQRLSFRQGCSCTLSQRFNRHVSSSSVEREGQGETFTADITKSNLMFSGNLINGLCLVLL